MPPSRTRALTAAKPPSSIDSNCILNVSAKDEYEIQKARPLVANLGSEIQFRTTSIPLATYPDAIKAVTSLIDEGKLDEAKAALQTALNALVMTTDEVFGGGGFSQRAHRTFDVRGEDTYTKVLIDLEDAYQGASRTLSLKQTEVGADGRPHVQERTLNVRIPKGVRQGQHIRLGKQGGACNWNWTIARAHLRDQSDGPVRIPLISRYGNASFPHARESWRELVRLSDAYRERNLHRHAPGRVRKAVITYPTVSLPVVRQRIVELGQAIGIPSVEIAYDEAVVAAVFYVMRELGGEMDFGLEAFVVRSRPLGETGTCWVRNVLVFDVGGGTTDIALIRLTMRAETPEPQSENASPVGPAVATTR
jgi:hypothetical protein